MQCRLYGLMLCFSVGGFTSYLSLLTDSVSVTLSLRFLNVTVAVQEFIFYDCSLVQQLSATMP